MKVKKNFSWQHIFVSRIRFESLNCLPKELYRCAVGVDFTGFYVGVVFLFWDTIFFFEDGIVLLFRKKWNRSKWINIKTQAKTPTNPKPLRNYPKGLRLLNQMKTKKNYFVMLKLVAMA